MSTEIPPVSIYDGDDWSVIAPTQNRQGGVVVSGNFIHNLTPHLHAAYARALSLSATQDVDAVRNLCEFLFPVLKDYEQAMREWSASQPFSDENKLKAAMAELDKVRRMLDEWH